MKLVIDNAPGLIYVSPSLEQVIDRKRDEFVVAHPGHPEKGPLTIRFGPLTLSGLGTIRMPCRGAKIGMNAIVKFQSATISHHLDGFRVIGPGLFLNDRLMIILLAHISPWTSLLLL